MLWTNTSAVSTRRRIASRAAGFFRSIARLRLLRLRLAKYAPIPGVRDGPIRRVESPSVVSTLMTSAPMSPSVWEQNGPSTTVVMSMTRMPESGPVGCVTIVSSS